MGEFDNCLVHGIHRSRYVASWANEHGSFIWKRGGLFEAWLRTLEINGEKLTEDEILGIFNYATNGKLELEESARRFLRDFM